MIISQIITDAPWETNEEFLENNKIDFVAHDDIPYGSSDSEDLYAPLKERGMFVATQRTEGKTKHNLTKNHYFLIKMFLSSSSQESQRPILLHELLKTTIYMFVAI